MGRRMIRMNTDLSVRELEGGDITRIADYWLEASPEFLKSMGADRSKLPERHVFIEMLENQIQKPLAEKRSFALIWLENNKPIGHCNVNPFELKKSGFLHLHLWNAASRTKGRGTVLVNKSIQYFFKHLKLNVIYSEPYALNEAPNNTLAKLGFTLEKQYKTIPGSINFEQEVKRWVLKQSDFVDQ